MKHVSQERTFLMLKPDTVKRGLIGEIISRIEQVGLKVVALQMARPTREQIDNHYPKDQAWITRLGNKTLDVYAQYHIDAKARHGTDKPEELGLMIREWLINYMTSGPVVKIVVQGVHAIDMVRKMTGNTMPFKAEMGTIRGDFSVDSAILANLEERAVENLVHASETSTEAEREANYWMSPEDIFDYERQSGIA